MKRSTLMKCLLGTVMILCLLCLSSCLGEDVPRMYGNYWYTVKDDEVTITSYSGFETNVTIPDTIKDMPVVAIDGDFAAPLMRTLTIPDSVRYIGGLAFMDCIQLEKVTLGNGIEEIGFHAFSDCEKLTYNEYDSGKYLGNEENPYMALVTVASTEMEEITLHPDTVVVAGNALENCNKIKEIVFPEKVLSLGDWALQYCTSLETVYIPASVKFVDSWAFQRCDSLQNIVVSPENTHYRSIDGSLFSYDGTHLVRYAVGQSAHSYRIPDGTVTIGSRAFERADNLREVIFPDSLEAIYSWAFDDCLHLQSLAFGNGLKLIQTQAFLNCVSLLEITLPDSLEEIEYSTFSGCKNLKKVTVGAGVTEIEHRAFAGCAALEEVIFVDPNGWTVRGNGWFLEDEAVDVSDPAKNAEYFTREYANYNWRKHS